MSWERPEDRNKYIGIYMGCLCSKCIFRYTRKFVCLEGYVQYIIALVLKWSSETFLLSSFVVGGGDTYKAATFVIGEAITVHLK